MSRRKRITVSDVADRLEQAAHTMRRLPKVTVQGYFSAWPPIVREAMQAYGWEDAPLHVGPPSAKHISEMDEALRWLLWLERDEVRIVWLRACGIRWKAMGRLLGWSVRKLQYDWRVALFKIAYRIEHPADEIEPPYKRMIRIGYEKTREIPLINSIH